MSGRTRIALVIGIVLGAIAAVVWLNQTEPVTAPPTTRPLATPATRPAAPRPNVILISLDTLRPDRLGFFGNPRKPSPNLDRFLAESVTFTNARAQAPWTLPSHMSLFTSMLPSSNGVDNINNVLPADIPTLAEILQRNGYATAALVNNGQMRAHWGFSRGFDRWTEFEVDTPVGSCVNVTNKAIRWLEGEAPRDKPYFLFLHYYDCHEPYAAPEEFRRAMGATLTGEQTRALAERFRDPANNASPEQIAELQAAYDAEIAWLDHEIGRLLAKIPADTMVVLFSDHGEAFEEHGWLLHGATLHEEEVRVLLAMRLQDLPGGAKPQAARREEAVALLDVSPTILAVCGVEAPRQFEGVDLLGGTPRQRVIASETQAVLEGRIVYGLTLENWKATYSLFDGAFALHQLPDETKDLAAQEPKAAGPLFQQLRQWVSSSEQYWLIRAHGRGDFDASIEVADGVLALFVPIGFDAQRDSLEVSDDGKSLRFVCYPGGETKSVYVRLSNPDASLKMDFKLNGSQDAKQVFVGESRANPASLPAELGLAGALSSPVIESKFSAEREGFYVTRHRGADARARAANVRKLDDETIRQLRSLGYIK